MKRFAIFAGMAVAVTAVAFSPGPVLIALSFIVMISVSMAAFGHSPFTFLTFFTPTDDHLTGYVHSRAGGPGAGGRHGPPRTIAGLMLAVWALIISIWSRAGHTVSKLGNSAAGYVMARTNTSAQPLPS